MNAKGWTFLGYAVGGLGMLAGLIGNVIANKQLEAEIDERIEAKLNPPEEEEEA